MSLMQPHTTSGGAGMSKTASARPPVPFGISTLFCTGLPALSPAASDAESAGGGPGVNGSRMPV
eukprot:2530675-Prymnesium_polylepis.2